MQPPGQDDPRTKRIQILLEEYKAVEDEQKAASDFATTFCMSLSQRQAASRRWRSPRMARLRRHSSTLAGIYPGLDLSVNDQKISAIGRYIRGPLHSELQAMAGTTDKLLRWETVHRTDDLRRERKFFQLFVDMVTFAGSSAGGIVLYLWRNRNPPTAA